MPAQHGIPPRQRRRRADPGLDDEPQGGERLRHEQSGRHPFARDIADDEIHLIRTGLDDIVKVTANIQGRPVRRGKVQIGALRQRLREKARLDLARPCKLLRGAQLLALPLERAELIDRRGCQGAVGGESLQVDLVKLAALACINHLDHPDHLARVAERHAEQRAGPEAGLLVKFQEEARVVVRVAHKLRLAVLSHPAGDAAAPRHDKISVKLLRSAARRGHAEIAVLTHQKE